MRNDLLVSPTYVAEQFLQSNLYTMLVRSHFLVLSLPNLMIENKLFFINRIVPMLYDFKILDRLLKSLLNGKDNFGNFS